METMARLSMWSANGANFSVVLLLLWTPGCSRSLSDASVTLKLQPALQSLYSGVPAYGPVSETGLVESGFCYAFNVTAPELIVAGTEGTDSCGHGPRGLGKLYGPFAYGSDAVLKVASGADRQFDLVGFKVPAGANTSCQGVLSSTRVTELRGGKTETRVQLFYDGKEVDPERRDNTGVLLPKIPDEMLYLFSR